MINAQIEIIIIASITAIACSIPGTFLVLRKMTMLSDAISHSILLGIVLAFFFVKQIDSPFLVLAAGMTGILTVLLVEAVLKTRLVKEDAAIGVIYPFMFSIAIILISFFASQVHIDTDAVLMGELAFAPLNRLEIFGRDMGPMAYYQIGGMAVINILLLLLFYKEIKLSLFDENYARALGRKPKRILYGLMVIVSFTTVVAFEVVGAIMVVGFMVGPAVIGAFFTRKLGVLLLLAPLIGILASLTGYSAAHTFNVSIAGSIVSVIGIFFILALLLAPHRGVISKIRRRHSVKTEFSLNMLLVHLWQHEVLGDAPEENVLTTVGCHFNWSQNFLEAVVDEGRSQQLIQSLPGGILELLPAGMERARKALEQ